MRDITELKSLLGDALKHVFFCGAHSTTSPLMIYMKDPKAMARLKSRLKDHPIQFKHSHSLAFAKTRSLEAIVNRLPTEHILLDPTATIERSKILVAIACDARKKLGELLKGCYFNSETRQIHFWLSELMDVRHQLEPILLHHTQRLSMPFPFAFTLSTQMPKGPVIAIDNASFVKKTFKNWMKSVLRPLKWPLVVASATSALGLSTVHAEPAVSGITGKLGVAGGWLEKSDFNNVAGDDDRHNGSGGVIEAAAAFPLGHFAGGQVHAYDGTVADDNIKSIDGIVFWRNPEMGLLGPAVKYTGTENINQTLYGLHGEAYFNQVNVMAEAGAVHSSSKHTTFYAQALVHLYATPDINIYGGGIVVKEDVGGQLGIEYQLGLGALPGLSIYADVGAGSRDLKYAFLGIRKYFGKDKSLIRRHREDNVAPTLDLILHRDHKVKPLFTS